MKRIRNYRVVLALFLLIMPLLLILSDGQVRKSISDYAYAANNGFLPMFLTISSSLFVLDNIIDRHKWYNTILGLSLLGIALTPHIEYTVLHFTFAGIFFAGSSFVMIFFSNNKQRWINIILASVIIIAVALAFLLNKFSLFYGEWIALFPISIHYIAEAFHKLD